MRLSQVLAVIMALALGSSALAQRSVAPIQIDIGEWTFTPIAFGNVVESFVAFRDPATLVGDNIACVWFKSEAGGTWSAHAWRSQSRDNAAAHVMATLGIGAEQSDRWGVNIDPESVASPTAPSEIRFGIFLDDPLAEEMEDNPDRREVLALLVEIGWEATRVEDDILAPEEDCDKEFGRTFLAALAGGVELLLTDGTQPIQAGADFASAGIDPTCLDICIPWTWWGPWQCGDWVCGGWALAGSGWQAANGPCRDVCHYERTATRTCSRYGTRQHLDCTYSSVTKTRTDQGKDLGRCDLDLSPAGCVHLAIPCPAAPNCLSTTDPCEPEPSTIDYDV